MFLSRMMTTSWSWVHFVLIRGTKDSQIAPHPMKTVVFWAPEAELNAPGKSEVPIQLRPYLRFLCKKGSKRAMSCLATVSFTVGKLGFACLLAE